MIRYVVGMLCFACGCAINQPPEAHFYGRMFENGIPEDTAVGTVVFFINASDVDSPQQNLRLSLQSNNFQLLNNGSVVLHKPLDYETNTKADFKLSAFDEISETLYSEQVNVLDVNDNPPVFTQARYSASFAEDTSVGTVIFNISITDVDLTNRILSVRCILNEPTPTACNKFSVKVTRANNREWMGQLVLAEALDYETGPHLFQIKLLAEDGMNTRDKTFEVTITDVQDTAPYFDGSFSTSILENVEVGTYVITVVARDPDTNPRRVRYQLISNPGELFACDLMSGNITTARPLDRENLQINSNQGIVTLTVKARELLENGSLGDDRLTVSTSTVTVNIIDVDDNPPQFSQTHYSVNVSEAIQNGQALPNLLMSVTDLDSGDNSYFRFVFSDVRTYGDVFEVSPPEAQGSATATLLVKNSSALDYDRGVRELTVEVIARETRTKSALSSTTVVTVYVLDADDNAPSFDVSSFEVPNVSELTGPGQQIALLPKATDIDTGMFGTRGIVYSLVGNGNNKFVVDRLSAVLRLANCTKPGTGNCLDYESVTEYNLNLVATDNNGTGLETRLPIRIKVMDENDNAPEFTSDNYRYDVVEETTNLVSQQVIFATDRDSSRNGNNRVRYAILSDSTQVFAIDSISGTLRAKRPVQYTDGNENGRITLTIGAGNLLDTTSKVDYMSQTTVNVFVKDINNNAPTFSCNYTANIPENMLPGIEILRVKAEDRDVGVNAAIEYSIVSSQNTFIINPDTGVISKKVDAILSYDQTPSYTLLVRATDKGIPPLHGDTSVFISVIGDKNKTPVFNPPSIYVNVSEDAGTDHLVTTLHAVADISAQLRYAFVQRIAAYNSAGLPVDSSSYDYAVLFRIDENSGDVRVNRALDITKVAKIIYTVRAIDTSTTGAQAGYGTLTIDILNANNNAPRFLNVNQPRTVIEESSLGQFVTAVSAVDDDRDAVTFDIIDQSLPNAFIINRITGIVIVGARIDYEKVQVVNITVRASDNGIPSRSTSQKLSINVVNINDNVPTFSQGYYSGQILENVSSSQIVANVSATDADLPPYGNVRYKLSATVKQFFIDEDTGVLHTLSGYSFDSKSSPNLRVPVIAYDGPGTPSLSSTVLVSVTVVGSNGHSPVFPDKCINVTLPDDSPVGSLMTKVMAIDPDKEDLVTYAISDDVHGRYAISSDGYLTTRDRLIDAPDQTFFVTASDQALHKASLCVNVKIFIRSGGPKWIFPAFDGDKIVVCENRPAGITINEGGPLISATRAASYGFLLNAKIVDETPDFRIKNNGEIVALRSFDRETTKSFLLPVVAKDDRGLVAMRYVMIAICDVDDNPPTFLSSTYTFVIEEGKQGCVINPFTNQCGSVNAVDLDLPETGVPVYMMTGGDANLFYVDQTTGVVYLRQPLRYNIKNSYQIQITVNTNRNGQVIINESTKRTTTVNINILPSGSSSFSPNMYFYAPVDSQIGECVGSVSPMYPGITVNYNIISETLYNGTSQNKEQDSKQRFTVGVQNGMLCLINMINTANVGKHYEINIKSGGNQTIANVWLTDSSHKIRIVVNGDTEYVNTHRIDILNALKIITGTDIVLIDSVGSHITDQRTVEKSMSDVIIYVVDSSTKQLYQSEKAINIINERINGSSKNIALSANIVSAQGAHRVYLTGTPATAAPLVAGGSAVSAAALLGALLPLLLLLLLPLLLLLCWRCCPCLSRLFSGRGKKYEMIEEYPAYQQGTYVDDWYEQSKHFGNQGYDEQDANWDSRSAHMLVDLGQGRSGSGMAATAGNNASEEVVTETRESFYNQMSGGNAGNAAFGNAAAHGNAAFGNTAHGNSAAGSVTNAAALAQGGTTFGSAATGTDAVGNFGQRAADGSSSETRFIANGQGVASGGALSSAVIVDSLIPAAAATTVVEEVHQTRNVDRLQASAPQPLPQLETTEQRRYTEQNLLSSLSPVSTDMLDSASTFNAQQTNPGHFSHTAIVSRHGTLGSDRVDRDLVTSVREFTTSSEPQHANYQRETGMTILLDAQPSEGMVAEDAEYEVVADIVPGVSGRPKQTVEYYHSGSTHGSGAGSLPQNGFTIELDANLRDGMVADHEEYVLTDDEGLSPDFYAQAQRSPSGKRKYRKTTTRVIKDQGHDEHDFY